MGYVFAQKDLIVTTAQSTSNGSRENQFYMSGQKAGKMSHTQSTSAKQSQKPIANSYEEQVSLLDPQKPCRCYRNLHTGLWSVKQGVVRFHTKCIFLKKVTFPVNEKVRQRVIANKRKEVHAFVMGFLTEAGDAPLFDAYSKEKQEVTYNPYKNETFVCKDGKVRSATMCCLIKQEEGEAFKMKVFASGILTEQASPDTIEKVPVHLL